MIESKVIPNINACQTTQICCTIDHLNDFYIGFLLFTNAFVVNHCSSWEKLLTFKGKDRGNGEFLDRCGVKNKSKIILVEDPSSKEKRFIEMCKNAKLQSAHRAKYDKSMEVEKLVVESKRVQKCVDTLDVLKVSNAGVKPDVIKSKWETMEAAQSRPQWEYFD
ncbi:hypothetical protein MKX01_040249 [Papaver californicum]|nr:hypothetical protein MKX01_040249 [Papaver californicum]